MTVYEFLKENEDLIKTMFTNGIKARHSLNYFWLYPLYLEKRKNRIMPTKAAEQVAEEAGLSKRQMFRVIKLMKSEVNAPESDITLEDMIKKLFPSKGRE